MTSKSYRKLTQAEIQQLEINNSSADNWDNIQVKNGFDAKRVYACHFSGENRIGVLAGSMTFFGQLERPCGLYHAHFHNCTNW